MLRAGVWHCRDMSELTDAVAMPGGAVAWSSRAGGRCCTAAAGSGERCVWEPCWSSRHGHVWGVVRWGRLRVERLTELCC